MESLQALIVRIGGASQSEINRAIFAYPDSGLLEALWCTLGEVRGREILSKIAEELEIALLEEEELRVSEEVLGVEAEQLEVLVNTHKALPLHIENSESGRQLLLGVSDPSNPEISQAFSRLYQMPVKLALSREQFIKNAFASYAGTLSLAARDAVRSRPEAALEKVQRYVEDPEARKAVQQVTATAIKHRADKVVVDLSSMFTKAVFSFEAGETSSVEISVSTAAFLAAFLRRGQIAGASEKSFEAFCRIDFKSSAVYCSAEVFRSEGEEKSPFSYGMQKLVLSDFSIERPDDPNFWMSIPENDSLELRRLFKHSSGLVLLVGQQRGALDAAARALRQSYPDLQVLEGGKDLAACGEAFQLAKESRVLLISEEKSVLWMFSSLVTLPSVYRLLMRGVVAYYHLPRVCECCAEHAELSDAERERVPNYANLNEGGLRRGKGCMVCLDSGYLGVTGVCSSLDLSGPVGALLNDGDSMSELLDVLAHDSFQSLIERGCICAGEGKTTLGLVFDLLPPPLDEFDLVRRATSANALNVSFDTGSYEQVEALGESLIDFNVEDSKRDPAPVTGAGVFSSGAGRKTVSQKVVLNPSEDGESFDEPTIGVVRESDLPLLLVIDDDADQRTILRRLFEMEGYSVETASDGIDGIVSANRLQPDLIVVDFMMPDLDGRETCRRLKNGASTAAIPVLALTAYPDPDVEYGLLKAGADDFCAKSVAKKVLLKRIERLVKKG